MSPLHYRKLTEYQFRDEYYYAAWLESGTWFLLQAIDVLAITILYSPTNLKSSLTSHSEVRSNQGQMNVSIQEMDDVEPENKVQEEEDPPAQPQRKARKYVDSRSNMK